MFEGALIKETLTDSGVLDFAKVEKAEIWKSDDELKYWTVVFFTSEDEDFPNRVADELREGWFADMKTGNLKLIAFNDIIYEYEIGNTAEKEEVLKELRARGIPESQFNWSE
jgi:hypothetical protein